MNSRWISSQLPRTPGLATPPPRRAKALWRVGIAFVLALALLAPSAFASSNVNFVGTWTPNTGIAWTITRENRQTGVCGGKTSLATSGYRLVACRVSGHKYAFTVTLGTTYKSRNTGTIKGNTLTGTFKDTNGTVERYSATR